MNYPWKMLKCSWRHEVKHIFHTFLLGMFVLRLEKHCMQLLKLYLKIQNEKCRKVLGKKEKPFKKKSYRYFLNKSKIHEMEHCSKYT